MIVFSYSNNAYPDSIRSFVIENYFDLLKSCSEEPFSAEMTVLVCEPIIHAVAYCESKAFFKQSSEALIQGLLPGGDDESEELDANDIEDDNESTEELGSEDESMEESDMSVSEEELEENEVSAEEMEFDSEEFDNIKDDGCESNPSDSEECDEDLEGESCEESCGEALGCHEECTESGCEEDSEEEAFIFDYSSLGKFIFDFGAREDVLVRNRRFLYELSQLIEEVATGSIKPSSCCHEGDSCCN